MNNLINSQDVVSYCAKVKGETRSRVIDMDDNDIIAAARKIMRKRCREEEIVINNKRSAVTVLQDYFFGAEREEFVMLLMDNQHRKIHIESLFFGTINAAAVYPREVVKLALRYNAAAVIIAHNHPSGGVNPSDADDRITQRIKEALYAVDIQLVDHIVCNSGTDDRFYSYAEHSRL